MCNSLKRNTFQRTERCDTALVPVPVLLNLHKVFHFQVCLGGVWISSTAIISQVCDFSINWHLKPRTLLKLVMYVLKKIYCYPTTAAEIGKNITVLVSFQEIFSIPHESSMSSTRQSNHVVFCISQIEFGCLQVMSALKREQAYVTGHSLVLVTDDINSFKT